MDDESGTYLALTETPSLRRCWLLQKALECAQLDRALDIARSAEAFIIGAPAEVNVTNECVNTEVGANAANQVRTSVAGDVIGVTGNGDVRSAGTPINRAATSSVAQAETGAAHTVTRTTPSSDEAGPGQQNTSKPTGLLISRERRYELIARMTKGASNAELASEYGLSPRQVQGIRMVAARTRGRRPQVPTGTPDPAPSPNPGLDEVVRYLRQQDDVVVPQGAGEFLLNGRFRVDTTELVSRANRIRSRHGKPAFQLNGQAPVAADVVRPSVGHPVFWKERVAAHPQS